MDSRHSLNQRGIVLVVVLLAVAVGTILLTGMLSRSKLAISQISRLKEQRLADYYALGAEAYAQQILYDDYQLDRAEKLVIDHLNETWSTLRQGFDIEFGQIEMEIIDLHSKFNLNNVIQDEGLKQFTLLLQALGINEEIAIQLRDWMDPDIVANPNGAEDSEYLSFDKPYRTANQMINHISELRLLKSIENEDYDKLAPYITALPPPVQLNINTVSARVLRSLSKEFTQSSAMNVLSARNLAPFKNINEFLQQDVPADVKNSGTLGVNSIYFQIRVRVKFDNSVSYLVSNVRRDNSGNVTVLAREQGQTFTVIETE